MSKRISHSLLDPWIIPLVPRLYRYLRIPHSFPPEGIVVIGHLIAISGAIGMMYSIKYWWAGLLAAGGVAGNHIADMVDGTHARSTGQCRNGGELLDHFTDPLSFSYWMIGISLSCNQLVAGLIAVICIYATAVLTNVRAKITGEFTLAQFGPTEFKGILFLYGLIMSVTVLNIGQNVDKVVHIVAVFLWGLTAVGFIQLGINLILSIREVNSKGSAPDTTKWQLKEH